MREVIIIIILCVLAPTIRAVVLGFVGVIYFAIVNPEQLKVYWTEGVTKAHIMLYGSPVRVEMPGPPTVVDYIPCVTHQQNPGFYRAECPECQAINKVREGKQVDYDEKTKGDYL